MSLLRNFVVTLARSRLTALRQSSLRGRKQNLLMGFVACRLISTHHVTKNMELITTDSKPPTLDKLNDKPRDKPLLVFLSWLMAQPKHVKKYTQLYLEQGFDVVHVSSTPWQMMWPVKGTRPVAYDLLSFLEQNSMNYQQVMIHGFSVGGYMWGELLTYVHQDRKRYDPVMERIVGQVWDSAVDVSEMCIGIPRAVFKNNAVMQKFLEKYLEYHLKTFYNQATQYYIRSSQMFHTNLVQAPALFLVSNTDTVGTVESNMRVRDSWESMGTPTYVKIFDKSPHVGHFRKYPKEYTHELYTFLNMLKMIKNEDKLRARM
ncbi:transmembrane protein 53-B [Fopius arisanus]|uniref:Transmembrane protein 53-B n=1 Tax=Fopius arisanus TaxID=64838 RepID=A0A9R1SVA5_9HYME|nr:PREDICTED: transmembrane protein 53-B [Fopius arisanus]XP_011297756.1 PREDICTED: transmembrane protein 53-B [Fopius arisanus]